MSVTFDTVLTGGGTASGIIVPEEIMTQLGPAKRYPVVVNVGDYSYRSSVSWYKGAFMISVSSAVKAEAGLAGGDAITVTLEHDTEPRVLELPAPVTEALEAAGALEAFRALSYSKQRAVVEPWVAAKSDATRDKNLEKILAAARG
jgi:hypothetical protein